MYDLERFISAQDECWNDVIAELEADEKETHWIWFVFPQLKGFSFSEKGVYYALSGIEETKQYFENEVLKERMLEVLNILLESRSELSDIMYEPDDLKFISSMTLFYAATEDPIFFDVLEHFGVNQDNETLEKLENQEDEEDNGMEFYY